MINNINNNRINKLIAIIQIKIKFKIKKEKEILQAGIVIIIKI